jgi:hypothetical protein
MLNVLLGHLLGDFLLQPGWMVAAKRRGLAGLATHAGTIVLCTGLVLIAELPWLWAVVLLAGATHLAVEVITITARRRLALSGASLFVIDQLLHFASLAALVWLAGPSINALAITTFGLTLEPALIALADGILFVTLLGSILVFEIDAAAGFEKRSILPYDGPRIAGMAERAASLVAAVAVHPALAIVPFVPRLLSTGADVDQARTRKLVDLAVGIALSALAYCFIIAVSALSH